MGDVQNKPRSNLSIAEEGSVRDAIIIGAGPSGLSAAKLLKDNGFSPLIIEKGQIGNSWIMRPETMRLLSNREWTNLPGFPIASLDYYPTRGEFLIYLLTYKKAFNLEVNAFEKVTAVKKKGDLWAVDTFATLSGLKRSYLAKFVVLAMGVFDNPNRLNIEGDELPHVHYHYSSPYYYAGKNVAIVGGGNSAVEAALDLINVGSNVTIIIKDEKFHFFTETKNLDDIREVFESKFKQMIELKTIAVLANCQIKRITTERVYYTSQGRNWSLPSDFVLIFIGYSIGHELIKEIGLDLAEDGTLVHDPETLETSQRSIYAVGPLVAGRYIHKYREHGLKLIKGMNRHKMVTD